MMTDPVADLLARVRNAALAGKAQVAIPHSKVKEAVIRILSEEGFVGSYEVVAHKTVKNAKTVIANLRYDEDGEPVIHHMRKISKPGQRVYSKLPEKAGVRSGLGVQILSTSRGVMTDRQAIETRVGGELLAEVW